MDITEYGFAHIHRRIDAEVIQALIFQSQLIAQAQKDLKLSPNYVLPPHARNNTLARTENSLREAKQSQPESNF
ncbi:MAG: hypothetical protein H7061_06535 [Bdellovibrionaceae bacterium]|nr:hypothetical protein [Bdellovibrio sp.]